MKKLNLIVALSIFILGFSSSLYSKESSAEKGTIKVGISVSLILQTQFCLINSKPMYNE